MAKNPPRAFTLIELLVVIAVIGVLATIAYPVYTGVQERAKVTKDLSNLRQLGLGTQTYMNDHDGVLFSPPTASPAPSPWPSQLNPPSGAQKYITAWGVFQSPFDSRSASELGDATTPISYGINGTAGVIGMSVDKISKPTAFVLFAPAEAAGTTVSFQGTAATGPPWVTVRGNGSNAITNPGGPATGGTYSNRKRVTALFADLHAETMDWTKFTSNTANPPSDPDGYLRWNPF